MVDQVKWIQATFMKYCEIYTDFVYGVNRDFLVRWRVSWLIKQEDNLKDQSDVWRPHEKFIWLNLQRRVNNSGKRCRVDLWYSRRDVRIIGVCLKIMTTATRFSFANPLCAVAFSFVVCFLKYFHSDKKFIFLKEENEIEV